MKRRWFHNFSERYASSYLFKILFLFLIYLALGQLGLVLQRLMGVSNQIWPATGAAFVAILFWGYSLWPAIVGATLVLHLINENINLPLGTQVFANCVEVIFAVFFCVRGADFHKSLDRMKDVFRLIQSALLSGFVGTIIVSAGILISGHSSLDLIHFLQYWAGHSLGLFMVAPIVLILSTPSAIAKFEWKNFQRKELLAIGLALIGTFFLLMKVNRPLLYYFYFPLILWPALRLGQKGVSLMVFIVMLTIIYESTLRALNVESGADVFTGNYLFIVLIMLQITGLIVSASITERELEWAVKEKQMQSSLSDLEHKMLVLKKEKEAAESISGTKTLFLTNVGHEIRTPLAALLGFSELLISDSLNDIEKKKIYEIIRSNGSQLLNVVNDVLDISKIEVGQFEIQKISVSVEDVLNDVKAILLPDAEKKGLAFKIESELNVPQKILTDSLRLKQILVNIVGNAIKFTEHGSVHVKIKTLIDSNGLNKIAFVVSDTGVGIPVDKIKDVFLPFTQMSILPTRRFGGTGLGLALSQRLARSLGGDIVLDKSTLGEGSEFTVTIDPGDAVKIAKSEQRQKEKEQEVQKIDTLKVLEGQKILVVDDDIDNQTLISHYLKSAGAIVQVAGDGVEAIQKIHTNQFDIILTDLLMPMMDGYELVKALRQEGYKKKVIALTAFELKEVRARCLVSGFNDCITKPIDKKNLIQSLMKLSAQQEPPAPSLTV